MPNGKSAGTRCVQLTADGRCKLYGQATRPEICVRLTPSLEMCGQTDEHAFRYLAALEEATRPESLNRMRCAEIKHGSPEYRVTVALRDEILRKPLGLCFSKEQLQAESTDRHLACYRGGRLVACLVLTRESGGTMRMRQVAVAADCQRQGIGAALVSYAERLAAELGCDEMAAHARETALSFYTQLGYTAFGDRFIEIGLPHVRVRKPLAK